MISAEDLKRLRSMGNRLAEEAADEIEALRLDAERYRWLRQHRVYSYLACGAGVELDADIDAAMKDNP